MTLADFSFVTFVSFAIALIALVFLMRGAKPPSKFAAPTDAEFSMLFHNKYLEHASPTALAALSSDVDLIAWSDMYDQISHRFRGLPADPDTLPEGRFFFAADVHGDESELVVEKWGDNIELHLHQDPAQTGGDAAKVRLQKAELQTLSRSSNTAPYPMWQMDTAGRLLWNNAAYAMLAQNTGHDPQKPLFSEICDLTGSTAPKRASISTKDGDKTLWFDVSQTVIDGVIVAHAIDIEAVISTEVAQRNFVQTLAKTFAQLSTGLAIFDRNGRLALFNPALIDLTQLPAEFLSSRPDLLSFFDRLREKRMMPEPKNYLSWRQEISNVIAAASDGRYQETWTLETGQTYRVSGRPHPDGAVAFLIEDISAEILVTRNFRAELDLGQSLLDALPDALVMFSASGTLTLHNQAFSEMWGVDPDSSIVEFTILDAIHIWESASQNTSLWHEISRFVFGSGDRKPWSQIFKTRQGQEYRCSVFPTSGNATAVRFSLQNTGTRQMEAAPVYIDAE